MSTNLAIRRLNSSLFVVLCALTTLAGAQNVYKCGERYGQTPCVGGSVISVDDPRDPAQKQQTDAAIVRDAKHARALESERIAKELAATTHPVPLKPAKPVTASASAERSPDKVTHPRLEKKAKPVANFVAQVPDSVQKPKRKKATKRRVHSRTG